MNKRKPVMDRNENDHLEMLRHPERWPHAFLLPLKHRSRTEPGVPGMGLLGFVFEDTDKKEANCRVYIGTMYQARDAHNLPHEDYPDLEALVADGWEVN